MSARLGGLTREEVVDLLQRLMAAVSSDHVQDEFRASKDIDTWLDAAFAAVELR